MLTDLFRSKPKAQDMWEARGIIARYGDGAYDRMLARAESSAPGSRDRAHWKRLAKVVEHMQSESQDNNAA